MATLGAGAAYLGGLIVQYAGAISAVASVASTVYTMTQEPGDMGGFDAPAPVNIGDRANPIDKTTMQKDSELGKLQLGEDEMDKSKRKKGKAAFKIALADEQKKKDTGGESSVGVQVAKPEAVGAQL